MVFIFALGLLFCLKFPYLRVYSPSQDVSRLGELLLRRARPQDRLNVGSVFVVYVTKGYREPLLPLRVFEVYREGSSV
jgi:hypothetical protein